MKLLIIVIIFILGLLFCCNYKHNDLREGFQSSADCPNLLVQKGKELHLIYSNKARIPGVNPIKFKNLEDYVEFLNWQRSKGIRCPVLYFQETYDAQNNKGYRMLPNLVEKQGGLPSNVPRNAPETKLYDANHNDSPYNINSYPGFDTEDQYVGAYTPLDKNFNSSEKVSANAMDTNWGGALYSEIAVDKGVYSPDSRKGNVQNPYKQPKMTFRKEVATRISNRQKKIDIKHPSAETQKEIASRYGGELMNAPENRAMIMSTASKK